MERAQLVGHGMAHAQEGVGESHTGHGGGIGHLFPGLDVGQAVVIGPGQVFKDSLQRLDGQAVGVIRSHHGGVGFQGVGHGIDAAGGGEALGGGHVEVGVDDRHVGQQRVIGQGVFHAALFIGDDREGRHLAARTGGGGNSDEISLFAHLGEGIDALADVHEAHGHILEIHLGMLIEHPHDLAGVHGAAAAQGDDHVGLEQAHLLRASLGASQGGIGGHVKEGGVLDAQRVQFFGDGLGVTVVIEEIVGHDEGFLLAHHVLQLIQRHRQAALLDIHLFRRAEPQHVLSPFGHGFDVQQVLDAHIFGYGVAAPAAAAQGEGGGHFEIVQIADAALGGRGVHHDTAGLHPGREGIQHLGLLLGVGIQGRSVAVAAVGDQPVGLIEGVLQIFGAVHGQHGAQLFMSEFFGERHGFHFADQHLGALRHGNAGQRRDFAGALTHDFGVQRAVDQDGVAHLVQLCAFQEPAAAVRELGLDFIIDAVQHDHALLGGADHAVVKGFGMDDGIDRQHQVGAVVDDGGHVARAHA